LLFSGQYWVGLQMAKIGKKLSERSLSVTEIEIKESITGTYYLVLISEELLRIIEENQENLQKILESTRNMYMAGMAESTDVDQIRVNLAQLENSKKSMERNIQLNYNMFRFQLGLDEKVEIHLTDSLGSILDDSYTSRWIQAFNVNANPRYQILEEQEELGKKQVDMQKWAYAPTLSGFYSYKEKILTTAFDLSPKHAAGLNLSVPIYAGGTRKAKLDKAKIELDKINRNKDMLEEQLEIQDKQLSFEYTNAYENYQVQEENVEVAERVYKSINNKYEQGLVSSIDLTQANSNYLQAQNNYYSAVLKLLQAKLKLEKLYNNL
jgi:outer membrane protein TolC